VERRGAEREEGGVLFGKNQTASVTVSLHIYNIFSSICFNLNMLYII